MAQAQNNKKRDMMGFSIAMDGEDYELAQDDEDHLKLDGLTYDLDEVAAGADDLSKRLVVDPNVFVPETQKLSQSAWNGKADKKSLAQVNNKYVAPEILDLHFDVDGEHVNLAQQKAKATQNYMPPEKLGMTIDIDGKTYKLAQKKGDDDELGIKIRMDGHDFKLVDMKKEAKPVPQQKPIAPKPAVQAKPATSKV